MPTLTEFMTCIFPPSYFLFLFVCVPSLYSFYSSLPSYECAYLSPSIFCFSSSPSAKIISSRTLVPYSCLYPIPGLPPTRQSCHIPRHQVTHSLIPTPSTLPPRPRPWLLKSNGYILSTFCFSIGLSPYAHNIRASYSTPPSYGTASLLARLFVSHISILLFPIRSCSLRSAL